MGGLGLEVFKFSLYLFVPTVALLHFGDPEWYRSNVVPYREKLFPPEDRTTKKIPTDQIGVREELARIRADKIARKLARENAGGDRTQKSV